MGRKKKKKKKNQDTGNISKNLNTIRLPRRNLLGGISSPNRQNKETNETKKLVFKYCILQVNLLKSEISKEPRTFINETLISSPLKISRKW